MIMNINQYLKIFHGHVAAGTSSQPSLANTSLNNFAFHNLTRAKVLHQITP